MASRFHKSGRAAAGAIAIFCAALILVSQAIAAAHFHAGAVSRDVPAQLTTYEGLCPLCELALHSPGSIAAATTVARGPAIVEAIFFPAPISSESPAVSAARVRAPPVAV
jgi:hypothetical protein